MTLDLRSRQFQVELLPPSGSSGALDVSSVVKSFTVANSQLDESGLILTTGTLTLHAFPLTSLAESLNPKLNPSRFARKCKVKVQIEDESGNLVLHPRGLLRILKTPKLPSRTNPEIQIQVGCLLSLQDYRQPASDDSGVTPGQPRSRTDIINALAALAKIPNLVEPIAEFPIDYPLPRLNGSYVQQMGQVAFAAGYCLWIDNQEQLRAKRIPTNPTPELILTVGEDDNLYDPLEGNETPCEVIYCTCTYPKALPTLDPEPTFSISSDANFSPADITRQEWAGMGTASPTSYRRSRRPRGLVLPDQYPGSTSLMTAEEEYNTDYFEEDDRGYLTKRVQTLYQPRGVLMPQFYPGDLQDIIGRQDETFYTYENEAVVSITTYTYEPQGVIDPLNTNLLTRSSLGLAGWTQERWHKTNNGWQKTTSTRSFKVGDSSPSSGSTYSSAGNNQPPAPEQRQQPYYLEDTQVTGKAKYSEIAGVFDERKRTFEVQTASTKAQLDYLAKLIGQRVWGQVNGISFGLDLRDEFNGDSYEPLTCIDWIEFDDSTGDRIKSRYLVTGEAFALTQRQCAIAADGLNLGLVRRYRTDGSATPPTSPTEPLDPNEAEFLTPVASEVYEFGGHLALTGSFAVVPYETTTDPGSTSGNLGLSGSFFGAGIHGNLGLTGTLVEDGSSGGGGEIEITRTHYWSFDDETWTDSVGGIVLTETNGDMFNSPGVIGNCAESGGYAWLLFNTDYGGLIDFTTDFVVRFWLNLQRPGVGFNLGICGSYDQWALWENEFEELVFSVFRSDFSVDTISIPSALTQGTWHEIEISIIGTQSRLRVDSQVVTGTTGKDYYSSFYEFTIGLAYASSYRDPPAAGTKFDEFEIGVPV